MLVFLSLFFDFIEMPAQDQHLGNDHSLVVANVLMSQRRSTPLQRKSDVEKLKSQAVKEEFYLNLKRLLTKFIQVQEDYYEHSQLILNVLSEDF